jgi:pSer/pThr/pTyr-binding forkhead associated (FHA) protein
MSRARLLLITPEGDITEEFKLDGPNVIIGRAPQSNVIIANTDVSRLHAQIVSTPNGYFVSDMGSTNGTFLNGSLIKPKQMFQLKSNDQVNLGRVSLLFQLVSDSMPPVNAPSDVTMRITPNQNARQAQATVSQANNYNVPVQPFNNYSQTALQEPTNHPYAAPVYNQQMGQPAYAPTSPLNVESAILGYAANKPAFSEDELSLANEIFGEESKVNKKPAGVSWASWNKTDLFNKKASAKSGTNDIMPDFSEEDLMQQVFGANIPSVSAQAPDLNQIDKTPGLGLAKYAPTPSQAIELQPNVLYEVAQSLNENQQEAYTVDTQSYYYPQAANEDPSKFLPENYAYDETKGNSRDPFADLKFKDEESLFSQFSAHSNKQLFTDKLEAMPHSNLDISTVIKKYALPLGLVAGVTVIAIVLFMRHSGVFG